MYKAAAKVEQRATSDTKWKWKSHHHNSKAVRKRFFFFTLLPLLATAHFACVAFLVVSLIQSEASWLSFFISLLLLLYSFSGHPSFGSVAAQTKVFPQLLYVLYVYFLCCTWLKDTWLKLNTNSFPMSFSWWRHCLCCCFVFFGASKRNEWRRRRLKVFFGAELLAEYFSVTFGHAQSISQQQKQ